MLFIMRFLIKCVYCLSAALCTVLWVSGKIFNVCVLVFSKKTLKNQKNQKMKKKQKNCICAVSSLGMKQNYLHTPLHIMHTHQC